MNRILIISAVAILFAAPSNLPAKEIDFERDIAPILKERCWFCHGEDEQESNLRLDFRHRMLKGGDSGLSAVVPGRPEKSYLIEVVSHDDAEMRMPPDEEKIPAKEMTLLTEWIKQGAIWLGQMDAVAEEKSDHWSFQPVVRPEVPTERSGSQNPVDAFLLTTLKKNGLSFSDRADARSLIRRASIVLTGLAPTPEETTAFEKSHKADAESAYEELIDRLLASPHFGERWAQHWLDVIRWAETNGSEANLYRKNAWIYRDYVVRAFNEDKPYDSLSVSRLLVTRWEWARQRDFWWRALTFRRQPSVANHRPSARHERTAWMRSCRPSERRSWASRWVVLAATTTSSIQSRSKITTQ